MDNRSGLGIFQPTELHREKLRYIADSNNLTPEEPKKGFGSFLQKCIKVMRRVGLTVSSVACAAIKNIPSYIKLEPTIKLGPGLSSISIGLNSDADFTLQDFIDKIKMAWWEADIKLERPQSAPPL